MHVVNIRSKVLAGRPASVKPILISYSIYVLLILSESKNIYQALDCWIVQTKIYIYFWNRTVKPVKNLKPTVKEVKQNEEQHCWSFLPEQVKVSIICISFFLLVSDELWSSTCCFNCRKKQIDIEVAAGIYDYKTTKNRSLPYLWLLVLMPIFI